MVVIESSRKKTRVVGLEVNSGMCGLHNIEISGLTEARSAGIKSAGLAC